MAGARHPVFLSQWARPVVPAIHGEMVLKDAILDSIE